MVREALPLSKALYHGKITLTSLLPSPLQNPLCPVFVVVVSSTKRKENFPLRDYHIHATFSMKNIEGELKNTHNKMVML